MSYQIRGFGDVATTRRFETLDEAYADAAGALDVTPYADARSTIGPWALWRVDGEHAEEILAAGELLAQAENWREEDYTARAHRFWEGPR